GRGSHIIGEFAYPPSQRVAGVVAPVILTVLYGSCGISCAVSNVSLLSILIAVPLCAGVPTICLVGLSLTTIRVPRHLQRLRAHLCSVLDGVDMTAQQQ